MAVKSSYQGTRIVSCTCTSKFQDENYGTGKRVANHMVKSRGAQYRCSVCGRVHEFSVPKDDKKVGEKNAK